MKYKRNLLNAEVEAFTFDEVCKIGVSNGAKIKGGLFSEFEFQGYHFKQEDKNCIMISNDKKVFKFTNQDMLVFNKDLVYSCDLLSFARIYTEVKYE